MGAMHGYLEMHSTHLNNDIKQASNTLEISCVQYYNS